MTIVTMHKVTPGRYTYYTQAVAKDDYYSEKGEASGRWYGKGAQALGIEGRAIGYQDEAYQRVSHGFHPTNDEQLRRVDLKTRTYRATEKHEERTVHPVLAYDLTVSVPKSLSIYYATCKPDERREIEESLRAANQKVMDYTAEHLCQTRSGRGGKTTEKVTPVFATFTHTTSRALDPQLHTHIVLVNSGQKQDGTWGAIDGNQFFQKGKTKELQQTLASIHANELRHQLEERLKLQTVSAERGQTFHIGGVPIELQIEMSKRARLIEQTIKEEFHDHGLEPKPKDKQRIVIETREKKRDITLSERFDYWQSIAKEFNFNPDQIPRKSSPEVKAHHWHQLVDRVSAELHRSDAAITEGRILHESFRNSQGRFATDHLYEFARVYQENFTKTIEREGKTQRVLNSQGIQSVRDYWMTQAKHTRPDLSSLDERERTMLGKAIDVTKRLRANYQAYVTDRRRRQLEKLKRQAPLLYITGKIDLKTYKALTRKPPKTKVAIEMLYATHQISAAQRRYYLVILQQEDQKKAMAKKVERLQRAEALYKAGEIDRSTLEDIRNGNFSAKENSRTDRQIADNVTFLDGYLNRDKPTDTERKRSTTREIIDMCFAKGEGTTSQSKQPKGSPSRSPGQQHKNRERNIDIDL